MRPHAGQANHFAQVFLVAKKAGYLPENVQLVHVPFGLVLSESGKKIKTRSGETIRLKDLLDEAVNKAKQDLENRLKDELRNESEEFINQVNRDFKRKLIKPTIYRWIEKGVLKAKKVESKGWYINYDKYKKFPVFPNKKGRNKPHRAKYKN